MKVSIIITCYNYGRFVADAINSALAQTHDDIEVIVVNDGSTDNSDEVIQKFGDRIIYINQENCGAAQARNNGVAAASGDYCICLDADDWIAPEYVYDAVAMINDNYDIIVPVVKYTDENFNFIGEFSIVKKHIHYDMAKNHLIDNIIPASCSMFSKKMWSAVGGYDINAPRAEDWIFWYDLISAGCKPVYLPNKQIYYKYRKHRLSRSNIVSSDVAMNYVYCKYGIFQQSYDKKEKINALYQLILNRPADINGLYHYFFSDLNLLEIRNVLIHSEEYKNKFFMKNMCEEEIQSDLNGTQNVNLAISTGNNLTKKICAIVITAYQSSNFIMQSIESLKSQRLPEDWMIKFYIGVDGCAETSKFLKDHLIEHYYANNNVGTYVLSNSLLAEAKKDNAEIFLRFDSDDAAEEDFLYNGINNAIKHHFVINYRIVCDENLNIIGNSLILHHGSVFMDKEALENLGGYDHYRVACDTSLIVRAQKYGYNNDNIENKSIFKYRTHPKSLTNSEATKLGSTFRKNIEIAFTNDINKGILKIENPVTTDLVLIKCQE